MSGAHLPDDGRAGSAVPFLAQLRTRGTLVVGDPEGTPRWTVRVQLADAYDAVAINTPPAEPLVSLKVRALQALAPDVDFHEDYVMKLRGAEVLDENLALSEAGALDGSIFILLHRRRRPVR
jgi:hypothetical protein